MDKQNEQKTEMQTPSFLTGELPEGVSLLLFNRDGDIIFRNNGKWLHPLLEMGDYLETLSEPSSGLLLHDKIAGLAAASIITRLGIKCCHIDLVSKLAMARFEKYDVQCSYTEIVERIDCQTERILRPDMDNEQIYSIILERAGRAR